MILGLSGKAASGKDTIADILIENYGWSFKVSFATALKKMCTDVFGLPEEIFYTQEGKSFRFEKPIVFTESHLNDIISKVRTTHGVAESKSVCGGLLNKTLNTPREMLQFIGTEVVRSFSQTYWVDSLINELNMTDHAVITDVRFAGEAKAISKNGGILVRVERPLNLRRIQCPFLSEEHTSETSLDCWKKWDFTLLNHGVNITTLQALVKLFVEEIGNDEHYKDSNKILSVT